MVIFEFPDEARVGDLKRVLETEKADTPLVFRSSDGPLFVRSYYTDDKGALVFTLFPGKSDDHGEQTGPSSPESSEMVPKQTFNDLHELHEERVDAVIRYKNLEHKRQATDTKIGWFLAWCFLGIPFLVLAVMGNTGPFIDLRIEQKVFLIAALLGIVTWSTIFWRRLRKEDLENMRERRDADRRLDELENRLRRFNPPLNPSFERLRLREGSWWLFTRRW